MTFTKEQLISRIGVLMARREESLSIKLFVEEFGADVEILKIALAALAGMETEPVAYMWDSDRKDVDAAGFYRPEHKIFAESSVKQYGGKVLALYTAPQPLTTSERAELENYRNAQQVVPGELTREEYKRRFMEEDNFDDTFRGGWNACRDAMLQGAEPVSQPYKFPDGYAVVPVEPTAEMISSGIEAHYERSQIQIHDRPAPGPMECAYVAMLEAAPQQEA